MVDVLLDNELNIVSDNVRKNLVFRNSELANKHIRIGRRCGNQCFGLCLDT